MTDLLMRRTAVISECGLYRYRLTREWGDGRLMTFAMLNPSKADADIDDPTIRRCMSFACREGAAGIVVFNLFAFRSADPEALVLAYDAVGPDNLEEMGRVLSDAAAAGVPVVCAWGAHWVAAEKAADHFVKEAGKRGALLVCLGKTKSGAPRHPLYVKSDTKFEAYP